MAYPFQPVTLNPDQVITAAQVNHLPIIAHYARRLGLVEIVNRLMPVKMEVESGLIVLGLVLLISLLIWHLIEHAMRTDLVARHTTLPGWDNKPTRRPSAYMMTWKFKGVIVLGVGQQRALLYNSCFIFQ